VDLAAHNLENKGLAGKILIRLEMPVLFAFLAWFGLAFVDPTLIVAGWGSEMDIYLFV